MFARLFFLIVILFGISASSLFAALMLPWNLTENLDNGFLAPKTGSKDVTTPEGCRTISGVGVTKDYFVPTKTTTEWNAFKANRPTGISIGLCGPLTYTWKTGNWSSCSLSCGGWTMNGDVWCERSDGVKVANIFCPAISKPQASQSCNTASCSGCIGMQSNNSYECSPIDKWNYFSIGSCNTNGAIYTIYNGFWKWWFPCVWPNGWGYYVSEFTCICTSSTPVSTPIPSSVNGSCGSANNVNTTTQPSSNLCTVGVATEVSQTGSIWAWSCLGVSGGSNANCSALNAPPPVYTYSWNTSAFGSCSVSCGPGTQTRNVTCRRSDNMTVADSYCTGAKPTASQSCNMGVCAPPPPPQASCPAGGPVEWDVWCSGSWPTTPSGSTYTVVDNTAPKTGSYTAQCNNGSWSKISSSCNSSPPPPQASCSAGGPLEWDVWCSGSWPTTPSGSTYTVVDTTAPKTGSYTAQCNNGSWSKISSSCSSSSINGVCGSFNGQTYVGPYAWADVLPAPGWLCSTGNPIQGSGWPNGPWNWSCQGSNGGSTVNCSASRSYAYSWNTSAYGSCSVSCGPGTQTRSVTCRRSDNMTVADSYCTGAKPTASQSCNMGVCAPPPVSYNETNVMRMGDAETNSLEWSINLRTGVANYWNGYRWWTQFTLLGGFTPQSVATMASYSKVAVSIEREGRPGSWNGRRWWHLPYQVQAPTALNDWTTIWRVDRKGGNSTDGQWSMKMTTLTGPYEYMFVSVYKYSDPVDLFNPVYDPSTTTITKKVQALGSTTVAQVNYNTTTPEWSKTYAPLSDCVVPSTLDPSGFCPSGWTPTKVVPSNSICGGATGNGKKEDPNALFWIYEPVLIMTQICRR